MSATSIAKSRQPAKEQKSQQERREEENLIAASSMQLLGYKCLTLHEWMHLLSLLKDGSKYQLQPFATQIDRRKSGCSWSTLGSLLLRAACLQINWIKQTPLSQSEAPLHADAATRWRTISSEQGPSYSSYSFTFSA